MTSTTRIAALLESISLMSLGVVGDFCLDAYWQLDEGPPELSLETGKPTHAVTVQRYSPGGAGNVAHNLAALGTRKVLAFGIVGDDLFGAELRKQMSAVGVEDGLIVQEDDWHTPVYAKPYRGAEEQNRIDFGRFNMLTEESEHSLISHIKEKIKTLDGLIVNQQLPRSIFTQRVVDALNSLAQTWPQKVFLVDARDRIPDFQFMVTKLNAVEAGRIFGKKYEVNESAPLEDLEEIAKKISDRTKKPVFVTRGRRGILIYDGSALAEVPALDVPEPTDPVGAGDTVVAALAASLSAKSDVHDAALLAMCAAAVTVRKLRQTGTASPAEIRNASEIPTTSDQS
jgi:rfaE bifunctional protein kinase chain/domain